MQGLTVLENELFDLGKNAKGREVKARAPGQSGDASNDINCRCYASRRLMDDAEYFDATGKHFPGWEDAKKAAEAVENIGKSGIMEAGGISGAYNDDNDPDNAKREAHAEKYYAAVRNSKKKYFVEAIAKNAGVDREIAEKTYKHVFEDKHMLEGGYKYFDADYYMAESFRRLRSNDGIQEHDRILLLHEALEYDIMTANPEMAYEKAHEIASGTYDYKTALLNWLRKDRK